MKGGMKMFKLFRWKRWGLAPYARLAKRRKRGNPIVNHMLAWVFLILATCVAIGGCFVRTEEMLWCIVALLFLGAGFLNYFFKLYHYMDAFEKSAYYLGFQEDEVDKIFSMTTKQAEQNAETFLNNAAQKYVEVEKKNPGQPYSKARVMRMEKFEDAYCCFERAGLIIQAEEFYWS
jgi:hypothetical protein